MRRELPWQLVIKGAITHSQGCAFKIWCLNRPILFTVQEGRDLCSLLGIRWAYNPTGHYCDITWSKSAFRENGFSSELFPWASGSICIIMRSLGVGPCSSLQPGSRDGVLCLSQGLTPSVLPSYTPSLKGFTLFMSLSLETFRMTTAVNLEVNETHSVAEI